MAMLILDCARCAERQMTHDMRGCTAYRDNAGSHYDFFVQCRACNKSTTWLVHERSSKGPPFNLIAEQGVINDSLYAIESVRPKGAAVECPDYTPADLKLVFDEGAECISINAWNASGLGQDLCCLSRLKLATASR